MTALHTSFAMAQNSALLVQQQQPQLSNHQGGPQSSAPSATSNTTATTATATAATSTTANASDRPDVPAPVAAAPIRAPIKAWRPTFILEGHAGPVWCLLVVDVRGILLSGSSDHLIKIWDIQDLMKLRHTLRGHQGIVHSMISLGNRVYSASDDKTIRVWDLNKIECVSVSL